MKAKKTSLPGVLLIEPDVFKDPRGYFLETYHQEKYQQAGVDAVFVQDNHSSSVKDTLRGLHLQVRHPQAKLIRVLQGEIADVVVDVRPSSPTFKKWELFMISSDNFHQIYVPAGYAHGFLATSDRADVQYKCSDFYRKDDELTVAWNDPDIGVKWPVKNPLLSDKDRNAPRLQDILQKISR